MKVCPVCKAKAFDDAEVCYGCLHRFTAQDARAVQGVEGMASDCLPANPAFGEGWDVPSSDGEWPFDGRPDPFDAGPPLEVRFPDGAADGRSASSGYGDGFDRAADVVGRHSRPGPAAGLGAPRVRARWARGRDGGLVLRIDVSMAAGPA